MWKFKHLLRNAGEDGGAPAATEEQQQTEQSSVLSGGAPAGGDASQAADSWIPEKYRVTGEDGQLNIEQSSRKLADAYTHLEKRLGTGDAPPKTPDEYTPEVKAEGFDWEDFKADPNMQAFMKAAHEKGITNDQMSFLLDTYVPLAQQLVAGASSLDAETCTEELKKTWKSDAEFKQNAALAHRAFTAYADDADKAQIDAIGNNPVVLRILAKVGKEMREDTPPGGQDFTQEEAESIRDLMKSDAYTDPKHQDHERVSNRVRAFYQKNYGDQSVA